MTSNVSVKRGPYARTARRRETVARAVLELVDEVGYEGVTTAQVSERAGISETTLLYHFPSKDHLLVAALARAEDLEAASRQAYASDAVLDARDIAAAAGHVDLNDRRFRLYLMLRGHAGTPGHPAADHFAQRTARQVDIFAQLIVHSQQAGKIIPGLDPRATARQVIAVWDGLTQLWISDPTFDVAMLMEDAIRRLTGQDLIDIQAILNRPVRETAR